MRIATAFWTAVVLSVVVLPGKGQARPDIWPTPLQASLDTPLSSSNTRKNTSVVASALTAWKGPDCFLKSGATLSGRVLDVTARTRSKHEAILTVLFDKADCNGQRNVPLALVLLAVINPAEDVEGQQMYAAGLTGSIATSPVMGAGKQVFATGSRATLTDAPSTMNADMMRHAGPSTVKPGEVIGAGKVTMDVGTGEDGASVLRSPRQDFDLRRKAELVLVAPLKPTDSVPSLTQRVTVEPLVKPPVISSSAATMVPAVTIPPDTTEICKAAECSLENHGAKGVQQATLSGAERSVALEQLGYRPRSYIHMTAFDHDATVNYLSNDQILVTFDLHRLRARIGDPWPAVVRRSVRAVLINATTGALQRVVDWVVEGTGQYLWPDGPDRVLVHRPGTLQELGADLKPEASFPASGDLLWVSASPLGERIAIALQRERHTRAVHEHLSEVSSLPPEEDAELYLYDRAGELLFSRADTSSAAVPVLLEDGGELITQRLAHLRWQLEEQNGNGRRKLVVVNSTCAPTASSPGPATFFVVGCASTGIWYRLLRADGRTLVKGEPSPQQIEQSAIGSEEGHYALRVVTLHGLATSDVRVDSSDLQDEEIAVHRSSDGRTVLLARTPSFPQSRASYELSPDGHQLALLTRKSVLLFSIGRR